MTSGIDYASVLADLKERRSQLDAAIAAIEAIIVGTGEVGPPTPSPGAIPADAFFNMSAPVAAVKYLQIVKRPQTPTQIAEALDAGGFTHQSKNLANTLYTALQRVEERAGEVVKVNRGWGLAEWYPGRPRRSGTTANGNASTESTEEPTRPPGADESSEPEQPV